MSDNLYIEKLRAMKPHFAEMNIKRLRVFGSQVRGDARPDSDIDLLVDFVRPMGLIGYAGVQRELEERLGISVDLLMEEALIPELKETILQEAQDV